MKIKKVYRRTLAIALRKMGYQIIGVEPNPMKPYFDVYLFEDTCELERDFCKALMM